MNPEFTTSERWEHYREEMLGGNGLKIYFETVRIAGGENIFRCHDAKRAQMAASAPALFEALKPFAAIARIYDAQVYPPDSDSQLISVCLGDLRKALAALSSAQPDPSE